MSTIIVVLALGGLLGVALQWPSEGGLFLTSIFVYRENGIAISSAQWFSTMKDGGQLKVWSHRLYYTLQFSRLGGVKIGHKCYLLISPA